MNSREDRSQLIGHIDSATLVKSEKGEDLVCLEGWILHPQRINRNVTVTRLGQGSNGLPTQMQIVERTDVARRLAHIPHAKYSGFKGIIPIAPEQGRLLTLKFEILLDDATQVTSHLSVEPQSTTVPFQFHGKNALQVSQYGDYRAREFLFYLSKIQFESFQKTDRVLNFGSGPQPKLSIIMVTYNQPALTWSCLESLLREWRQGDFELIIVDNCSGAETQNLLARIRGAKIIRNQENIHFLRAANQAVEHACGEYLLFLNNDTLLTSGCIDNAMALFSNEDIGVVGAKLIRPDGRIQEAGSKIFTDGSTESCGRGAALTDPRYLGIRDVDYVSGAFLMTKRELFTSIGGFDARFEPAYYEDVDFCAQVRAHGKRVVCTADSILIHVEKGSSESIERAESLTLRNRQIFRAKYADHSVYPRTQGGIPLLVLDDFIPTAERGQGLPRAACLLRELCGLGYHPTFVPLNEDPNLNFKDFAGIPKEVKSILGYPRPKLKDFLAKHGQSFTRVLVSRPANMDELIKYKSLLPPDARIIYDAEAIFASRSILKKQVETGVRFSAEEINDIVSIETRLAREADIVIAVSESEAVKLRRAGVSNVQILAHGIQVDQNTPDFHSREGFLMVGPTLEEDSPNSDGVIWFIDHIFPTINALMRESLAHFTLAGQSKVPLIRAKNSPYVDIAGLIPNLTETYNKRRVFVAPIRYSAGIPLKVIEASAHGLPSVITPLLAEQLGWRDGVECMIGEDAEDFAVKCKVLHSKPETWERIRRRAIERVAVEYSIEAFRSSVRSILDQLESYFL